MPRHVLLLLLALTGVAHADPSTLRGSVFMGYQGWFQCQAGTATRHWFSRDKGPAIELLPDVSEYPPEARCALPLRARDGSPVEVFDSRHPAVADRHMQWLEQAGIQGVALARFVSALPVPAAKASADAVLANIRAAAPRHGRSFFVMYDASAVGKVGAERIAADWRDINAQGIARDPAYQRHDGAPVLGVWGIGIGRVGLTPQAALDLLRQLKAAAPAKIVCGTPAGWRGLDEAWNPVWKACDVISPWSVGRYRDAASADRYQRDIMTPDLAATRANGTLLMPVVFPGFSWSNLMRTHDRQTALNEIPRDCGRFFWRQVANATEARAETLFVAMFDEVDEGTAMFKMLPRREQVPDGFLALDQEGCAVPNDWYLRLAGAAQAALRSGRPAGREMPGR